MHQCAYNHSRCRQRFHDRWKQLSQHVVQPLRTLSVLLLASHAAYPHGQCVYIKKPWFPQLLCAACLVYSRESLFLFGQVQTSRSNSIHDASSAASIDHIPRSLRLSGKADSIRGNRGKAAAKRQQDSQVCRGKEHLCQPGQSCSRRIQFVSPRAHSLPQLLPVRHVGRVRNVRTTGLVRSMYLQRTMPPAVLHHPAT